MNNMTSDIMTERHVLTKEKLSGNNLRVVSYNMLADAHANPNNPQKQYYPYCPVEYLEFSYRRKLLITEISNYNADIIFLQECDQSFFENDIKELSNSTGYSCFYSPKYKKNEGEAILFRKDRFNYVKSYDIRLTKEIVSNGLYKELMDNITEDDNVLSTIILTRNTVLQVVLVESIENPGNYIILANTHLYFNPEVKFLRLLQMITCVKYLENLINDLTLNENKNVTVLFAGDFNSEPHSPQVQYIFFREQVFKDLTKEERKWLEGKEALLSHSLDLQTFSNFRYTTYTTEFKSHIDYIFYDQKKFILKRVIRMPPHEKIIEFEALPSKTIPSDHLAVVMEFEWKKYNKSNL